MVGVTNLPFFCFVVDLENEFGSFCGLLTSILNCLHQEGVEEEEEVIKQRPQGGVLADEAWAGEATRIVVTTAE